MCKAVNSPEHDPDMWVTVGDSGAQFESIETALNLGYKNIFVREGIYEIKETIFLGQNHAGVHIRDASRERIILKFVGKETFL